MDLIIHPYEQSQQIQNVNRYEKLIDSTTVNRQKGLIDMKLHILARYSRSSKYEFQTRATDRYILTLWSGNGHLNSNT